MVVESVRVHMLSSQHVVILRDTGHDRYLPIWIGPSEANAIAMRLQGVTPERPMTHDLFSQTLSELGVSVKRIIVSDLAEDTFRARLLLQVDGREVDLDARPSDAIALAVRAGVPIFATDAGARSGRRHPEGAEEEKLSVFREFVNSLNVDLPDEPEGAHGRPTKRPRLESAGLALGQQRLAALKRRSAPEPQPQPKAPEVAHRAQHDLGVGAGRARRCAGSGARPPRRSCARVGAA